MFSSLASFTYVSNSKDHGLKISPKAGISPRPPLERVQRVNVKPHSDRLLDEPQDHQY